MNVLGGSQNARVGQLSVTQVNGGIHVHAAQDKDMHELLQPIEDASHTRDRERSPPDSACTKGTRVGVVMKVTTWAASDISDPDEPHILWMHGYVGCGKSAISQEVCDKSDRQGRPVVSFFFFRNAGDRSKIWRLATTLASQMATVIPETEPFIRAAVKANPALTRPDEGGVSLVARMQRLVYRPFKASVEGGAVTGLAGGPLLVVLDGLDECNDKKQVQELIDDMLLFFEENPSIPLRVFITSRVEQHIKSRLDDPGVRLVNLVDHCSDYDIATFLEVLFDNERRRNPVIEAYVRQHGQWPTVSDKQKLVTHIGGSFIFASLLFKYIMGLTTGDGFGSPITPMDRLPHTLNMNPGLDGLYAQTLARSEHLPHFLNIISTIALLERPLPTSGIAALLGINTYEVVNVLVNLQAIIQVPGTDDIPVTVYHTSLRDFLTTESRSDCYYAQPRHRVHLFFRFVECELEFHRRNLGARSFLDGVSPAITDYELRFSPSHFYEAEGLFELSDRDPSITLRRQALELRPVASGNEPNRHQEAVFYLAALPWAINIESLPSDLKKEGVGWYALFHPKQVPMGTAKREKPFDIDLVHSTLTHEREPSCVKFSPNGESLAIGCEDGVVYICCTQTGMNMRTFGSRCTSTSKSIQSLSFSPCGRWLATGRDDGIIKIMDIATNCIQRLDERQGSVSNLEFSPDGRLLISGSRDKTVRVWDVGRALADPSTSSATIRGDSIGSEDGAGMTDGAAKPIVLNLNHQAGDGSEDPMWSDSFNPDGHTIAVSPDGQYVASSSGSIHEFIQLWDLRQSCSSAGESRPPVLVEGLLNGHSASVRSLSFAKNGRFLVAGTQDYDVRIWAMGHLGIAPAPGSLPSSSSSWNDRPVTDGRGKQKSRCTMRLVGHTGPVLTVAVSPDGRWVVSGDCDGRVMCWDLGLSSAEDSSSSHGEFATMNTAAVTRDREAVCCLMREDRNSATSVDLSPVGNMLATAYESGEVMIWRYKHA